ncbi:MAG: hypothetical protein ACYC61_27460 [Isosphaeraceae bacterium]
MLPSDSPFTNVAELKELPHAINGSFAWLSDAPRHAEWAIGDRSAAKLPTQLASVTTSAARHGVTLPGEFVAFIGNPDLHARLRSVTACYLDVADRVLPFADGYLVRFLADQQGCAFWYLFLNRDGSDHCVVCSFEYFDADDSDDEGAELSEAEFQFQAESFEAFLVRFWLENEIGFAEFDSTPPPDVAPRFLKLYAQ